MKMASRSGSTSFHQTPSRFNELATITPSATAKISPMLAAVTPEPTTTGRLQPDAMASISDRAALSPVR